MKEQMQRTFWKTNCCRCVEVSIKQTNIYEQIFFFFFLGSIDTVCYLVQATSVWSTVAKKTLMVKRTSVLLWLQRGSSSSPTLPTDI